MVKVVELHRDSTLELLAEVANDIIAMGIEPATCIIITDDQVYQVGHSGIEKIIYTLETNALHMKLSSMYEGLVDD